jgi:hypothetical protein
MEAERACSAPPSPFQTEHKEVDLPPRNHCPQKRWGAQSAHISTKWARPSHSSPAPDASLHGFTSLCAPALLTMERAHAPQALHDDWTRLKPGGWTCREGGVGRDSGARETWGMSTRQVAAPSKGLFAPREYRCMHLWPPRGPALQNGGPLTFHRPATQSPGLGTPGTVITCRHVTNSLCHAYPLRPGSASGV